MANALIFAHHLFGWLVLTMALSYLFAFIYPYAASTIARTGVVREAFLTLLFVLLAPVTAAITLVILSSPTMAHLLVEAHCHGELCEPHSLELVMETMLSTVILALGVAGIVMIALLMASQLIKSRRQSQMLEKLSELDDSGFHLINTSKSVAWCFGIFKPRIYLSSGLVESLSDEQRKIILAHELVHAFQYHNLRKWLISWATVLWPKKIKQQIRQDFSQLCEFICDLKAFCAVGNSMEAAKYFEILKKVYGNKELNNTDQNFWQIRLNILQRELTTQQNGNVTISIQGVFFGSLIVGLWLVLIVVSVYLGHPLLEHLLY